jgi:MinD superfamily P-loop ATPase
MTTARRTRFFFFLNPYADMAFTRCPKCEAKTKLKKLPLVIHVEPQTICVLNKTCRFCPACELVIARQSEIEPMLRAIVNDRRAVIEMGEYLVVGTLDRVDWRAGQKGPARRPGPPLMPGRAFVRHS